MLYRAMSVTLNGTPRHRRHAAAAWPHEAGGGMPAGKRRLKGRLAVTVAALTVACIYSLAIFNAGKQAAKHTEAQLSIIVSPGKRHRKLENGMVDLGQQQAVLATAQAGDSGGVGGALAEGAAQLVEQQEQQQQVADSAAQQQQQVVGGAAEQQQQQQVADSAAQQQQQQDPGQGSAYAGAQAGVADAVGEGVQAEGQQLQQQGEQEQPQDEQQQQGQEEQQQLQQQGEQEGEQEEQRDHERPEGEGQQGQGGEEQLQEEQEEQGEHQRQEGEGQQGQEEEEQEEEEGPGADAGRASAGGTSGAAAQRKSPYHKALEKCESLACLRQAAKHKRFKGQFLFPHFLIVGWQKCATTSLFHHLKDHPAVITPLEKEPEFFSYDCQYDPENCPPEMEKEYIQETLHLPRVLKHNLYASAFEGSTHYGREGPRMAQGLRRLFPWVKLIASLREPISRYLSMLGHNLDKNTYTCLRKRELFECLELELPWNNYTMPVMSWLETFPQEQLMLLQYESLTAPEYEQQHLQAVKSFLGLDPRYPATSQLPHSNTRAARLGQEPEGWHMQRWQYERLIAVVRPDAESIAGIVTRYGFGDGQVWMANWEAAWKANLDACGADGTCTIV